MNEQTEITTGSPEMALIEVKLGVVGLVLTIRVESSYDLPEKVSEDRLGSCGGVAYAHGNIFYTANDLSSRNELAISDDPEEQSSDGRSQQVPSVRRQVR